MRGNWSLGVMKKRPASGPLVSEKHASYLGDGVAVKPARRARSIETSLGGTEKKTHCQYGTVRPVRSLRSCPQRINGHYPDFIFRRANPTNPSSPDPNSQTAAGTGTAGTYVPSICQYPWNPLNAPPLIRLPQLTL